MSKIQHILSRKFSRRWSDLEMLVLLEIAHHPATFSELILATGGSSSGVWHCLQRIKNDAHAVVICHANGRDHYTLTTKGEAAITEILA